MKLTSNTDDLADELNELKLKIARMNARRNAQINSLKRDINRHYTTRSPSKYSKFYYNNPTHRIRYFYPGYPSVDDLYLDKYYEIPSTAKSVVFTSDEHLNSNFDPVPRSTILTKLKDFVFEQEKQFTNEFRKNIDSSRKLRKSNSYNNLTSAKSTLADHSLVKLGGPYLSPLNKKDNFYKRYNEFAKRILKPFSSANTKIPPTARLQPPIDFVNSQPRWSRWYHHYLASRLQYPSTSMDYYSYKKVHPIDIPTDVESIMNSAPRYQPTMPAIRENTTKKSRYHYNPFESDIYLKCSLPSWKQYYYTQKLRSKSNSEDFLKEYDPRYEFFLETASLDSTDNSLFDVTEQECNLAAELPEKISSFIDEYRDAIYEDIIQNIRLKQQAILTPRRRPKNKYPRSNVSRSCERNPDKSTENLPNCAYIPLTYSNTLPRSRHELASRSASMYEKTNVCGENKYASGTPPSAGTPEKYTDYLSKYETATEMRKSDYPYPVSKINYSGDLKKEFPSRDSSENNEYNKNDNSRSNGSKFSLYKDDDENVNGSKYSLVIDKEPQTTKFEAHSKYKSDNQYSDGSKYVSEFIEDTVGVHNDYKNDNQYSSENKYSSDPKRKSEVHNCGVYNGYRNDNQYLCANKYSSEPVTQTTNVNRGHKNDSRTDGRKYSSESAKTPLTQTLDDINVCKNDKTDSEKLYKNNSCKSYQPDMRDGAKFTKETPDNHVFQELEIQSRQEITSTNAESQKNETFFPTRRFTKSDNSNYDSPENFTENFSQNALPYSNDSQTLESNYKTFTKEPGPVSTEFQKIITDSMNDLKQNQIVNPSPIHSRKKSTRPSISRCNSVCSPLAGSEKHAYFQRKVSVDRFSFLENCPSIDLNESPSNTTDRVFHNTIISNKNHPITPSQELTDFIDTTQEYYPPKLNRNSEIDTNSKRDSQIEYSKPVSSLTQPTKMVNDGFYEGDLYHDLNENSKHSNGVLQNNDNSFVEHDARSDSFDHQPPDPETREYDQEQCVEDPYRNSDFGKSNFEQSEGTNQAYQYDEDKYESTYQPDNSIDNRDSIQEISQAYDLGSSRFNQYSDQGAYFSGDTFNNNVQTTDKCDTTRTDTVYYNDQRNDQTANCFINDDTPLQQPDYNYNTSSERYLQNNHSSEFPSDIKYNSNISTDHPSQHTDLEIHTYSSEQPASLEQFSYNSMHNREPNIENVDSNETQIFESKYIEEHEKVSDNTNILDKPKDVTTINDRKKSTENEAVEKTTLPPRRASRMLSQTSTSQVSEEKKKLLTQSPDVQKRTLKTKLSDSKLKRAGSIVTKTKSPTVKET